MTPLLLDIYMTHSSIKYRIHYLGSSNYVK